MSYDMYADMKQLQARFRRGFFASPHSKGQDKADRELLCLLSLNPFMLAAVYLIPWVMDRWCKPRQR